MPADEPAESPTTPVRIASPVAVPVAVEPGGPDHGWIVETVGGAGGEVVPPAAARGLVWTIPTDVDGLRRLLADHPAIEWVQLPFAGVEDFAAAGVFDDGRTWTAGQGVYAEPVAEHVLALLLAGMRGFRERFAAREWGPPFGESLFDRKVVILGAGGIARVLIDLLAPFRCEVTVVRRRVAPVAGAAHVVAFEDRVEAVRDAVAVVVALSLTPETRGAIGAAELRAMGERCWLVNVGRGGHVVTDDLVVALREGWIAGAALDVTDPEPLPREHPLWDLPDVLLTPHVANTPEMRPRCLGPRIAENVRRFARGDDLVGIVDPLAGY